MTSAVHQLLRGPGTARGVWCSIPSPYAAEVLADAGFEVLVIDRQHGLIGRESMIAILQAVARTSTVPLVRVAANEAAAIGEALDAGAKGVIVPMVSSGTDAAAAVKAARYAPAGRRSFGPARSSMVVKGSPVEVNEQVAVIALVETSAGVDAIGDICATTGLDGVMIGWADLALELGCLPGAPSSEVDAAILRVLAACEKMALPVVMARRSSVDMSNTTCRVSLLGSDVGLLRSAALAALRAE